MTTYGIKYLNNGKSLNGDIKYPLNQWIKVPGNGAYVSHTGGLWSAGKQGTEYAIFECEGEVMGIDTPNGVRCWRHVRRVDNQGILDRLLDTCAAADPQVALVYAASLLNSKRLDTCAAAMPWTALKYAASLLNPKRLDTCAAAEPWIALKYAADLLNPKRLDTCAAAAPWAALKYAADLLNPKRLDTIKMEI